MQELWRLWLPSLIFQKMPQTTWKPRQKLAAMKLGQCLLELWEWGSTWDPKIVGWHQHAIPIWESWSIDWAQQSQGEWGYLRPRDSNPVYAESGTRSQEIILQLWYLMLFSLLGFGLTWYQFYVFSCLCLPFGMRLSILPMSHHCILEVDTCFDFTAGGNLPQKELCL